MGIKAPKKIVIKRSDQFDLKMTFNDVSGVLTIESIKLANRTNETFVVDGVDLRLDFDATGIYTLLFDPESPKVTHTVRIKAKGSILDDQRLAFFY